MASTQADSTLVKGAFAAAGGNIENYGLAAAQGLTNIAKDTTYQLTPVLKERRDRFEKFADYELARNAGSPSPKDHDLLEKELRKRKNKFVWLGKKDRQMLMRELELEEQEQLKLDNTRQNIANKAKNGDKGLNNDFVNGKGQEILDELDKGVVTNKDGQKGIYVDKQTPCDGTFSDCFRKNRDMNIQMHGMNFDKWTNFLWAGEKTGGEVKEFHPYQQDDLDGKTHTSAATLGNSQPYKGKWQTLSQIDKTVDENSYDNATADAIQLSIDETIQRSQSILPGENGVFNYDQERRKYKNMINKGNITSLTTQEFIPGRTFKNDLIEMLENNTYESLGVKERKVNRLDPTPDTPVTPEDAATIADNLLSNERLTKRYLTTYFTNYAEQNWQNAAKSRKGNNEQPPQQGSGEEQGEEVFTDHDASWDYKVINGKWHTRSKNSDGRWLNINDAPKFASSIKKLNKKYPDAGGQKAPTGNSKKEETSNDDVIEWTPSNPTEGDFKQTSGGGLYSGVPTGYMGAMK